jgi:hypothetical protein
MSIRVREHCRQLLLLPEPWEVTKVKDHLIMIANRFLLTFLSSALISSATPPATAKSGQEVLTPALFQNYVERFNSEDREIYSQAYPNAKASEFLSQNIPLFECPDKTLEQTYYFRWWTYRKHLKETPDGWVITEFLPAVGWAGKYNTISCPAAHHVREGRWLQNPRYVSDYLDFWLHKGGNLRSYSFWIADSVLAWCDTTGNYAPAIKWLPDLVKNYESWEKERLDPRTGLFWQFADRDGMESAISGDGFRPSINSYMYGDATAIVRIATMAGEKEIADAFQRRATTLKDLVQTQLWNEKQQFFEVRKAPGDFKQFLASTERTNLALTNVRELHGYLPWYFNLPDARFNTAWKQLVDPSGFSAPYGLTSAEQRHPRFVIQYQGHECQWNGPVWPFATAQTLTGLANQLNKAEPPALTREEYFQTLLTYARSHRLVLENGKSVSWIDEVQNPNTGDWIARTRLKSWKNGTWDSGKGGEERGKDYNHSTFCDLIINGLIGLRPQPNDTVLLNPLVPENTWDYFCLDRIPYHGRTLTILWDKRGTRYGKGAGLHLLSNGNKIASAPALQKIEASLP